MLALAAERAGGAHTYFVTPQHTSAAREALGPDALLAPEVAVVVEPDAETARKIAREYAAHVPRPVETTPPTCSGSATPNATSPTAAATASSTR